MASLNINNAAAHEQARRDANLRLLQRKVDPSIVDILGNASHVVLYNFEQQSNTWEKSNVEGSMFLTVRPAGYLLVILDRNSPNNYSIVLTRDFQLQHNDPYLIFKNYDQQQQQNATATIRGIWFPNANERSQMNDLLSHILQDLKDNKPLPLMVQQKPQLVPPTPPSAAATMTAQSQPVDPASATAALLASLNVSVSSATGQAAAAVARAAGNGSGGGGGTSSTTPIRQPSPSSNSVGSSGGSGSGGGNQPTLDKKSLQLALLSLISDERFLDLLHAKYLMVHHARSNRGGGGGNPGGAGSS